MVSSFVPEVNAVEIIIGINLSFQGGKTQAQGNQQAGIAEN
jgi:hypothetical protein